MVRLVRRQILVALAGSLVILGLLGSLALSSAGGAIPYYNQAYVEGVVGTPMQLNPLLQAPDGPPSERDLSALIFAGLTRPGPDGAPVPMLAEQWIAGDGGRSYTFTLRSNLRWHDGARLTAGDVVFTVESIQRAGFPDAAQLAARWRGVRAAALDDLHVRFTLNAPFAPFLAMTGLSILPRHLLAATPVERWGSTRFSRQPVGAGPFRLHSLSAAQAALTPFESAPGGRPAIDLLVLRFYPSTDAARQALRQREVQGVASEDAALPDTRVNVQALSLPLASYTTIVFNLRTRPLDSLQLRQALARAVDREELIRRVLQGSARPLDTPIVPQSWAASGARLPAFDRAAAEQALDALGWRRGPDGLRVRDGARLRLPLLTSGDDVQLATAREIARQWRVLGVDVPIDAQARDAILDRIAVHGFTLLLATWDEAGADPDPFPLWHSSQAADGMNYAGLTDPTGDAMLVEARTTSDQTRRKDIYGRWAQRWVAIVPSLPLYQHTLSYQLEGNVHPAGLEPRRLLQAPSARFDEIAGWSTGTP